MPDVRAPSRTPGTPDPPEPPSGGSPSPGRAPLGRSAGRPRRFTLLANPGLNAPAGTGGRPGDRQRLGTGRHCDVGQSVVLFGQGGSGRARGAGSGARPRDLVPPCAGRNRAQPGSRHTVAGRLTGPPGPEPQPGQHPRGVTDALADVGVHCWAGRCAGLHGQDRKSHLFDEELQQAVLEPEELARPVGGLPQAHDPHAVEDALQRLKISRIRHAFPLRRRRARRGGERKGECRRTMSHFPPEFEGSGNSWPSRSRGSRNRPPSAAHALARLAAAGTTRVSRPPPPRPAIRVRRTDGGP